MKPQEALRKLMKSTVNAITKNSHYKPSRVPTQGGNVSHKKWEGVF